MAYLGKQPALQSNEFREEFNITSTTSTIATSGFVVSGKSNYLDVYKNGVLLGSDDYTLGADRKTITLASNAIAGDIIVVIGRRNLTQGVRFSERRHEHTIANNETTVTFPYPLTGDSTDVYLNGVKLASSDFSINVSTKVISFTVNPVNGDVIAIVSREPATSSSTVLPIVDSNGGSVISESNGSVVVNAGTANIGSNALVIGPNQRAVFGSTSDGVLIYGAGGGSANKGRIDHYPSADDNYAIAFYNAAGSFIGNVFCSSSGTAFNTSSDYRLKENVTEISDGINRVKQLNPSRFNFIVDPDNTVDGFIAHEVQPIVPEAVSGEKDAVNEDGSIDPQGIDQSKLVPLLTAALQESIALIESQQSQIDALTTRIEALEAGN